MNYLKFRQHVPVACRFVPVVALFAALLSCAKPKDQHSSAERLREIKKDLDQIEPIDRAAHRNPQLVELTNAQSRVVAALAKAGTAEEKALEVGLYDKFARQLKVRQLLAQQLASPSPPSQTKIVGGRPAASNQIPYQAALIFTGYSNPLYGQYCGATVINQNWVLTAGHCVGGAIAGNPVNGCLDSALLQTGDIQVFVNSTTLSQGGTLIDVASFCVNPSYAVAGQHQQNDIALVKLATPLNMPELANVPDDSQQTALFAYSRNATISGWGQTGPNSTGSDALLFGTVQVILSNETCQKSYGSDTITPSMVCATSSQSDTCYGDSGGPLVMRTLNKSEYVEGITSWAAGQCGQGIPSVYTRVPQFSPWISSVTGVAISNP